MTTRQPGGVFRCGNLLSKHPRMQEVFGQIAAFGNVNATVLIEGESGTGKQKLAWAIHQASIPRRSGPFVVLNCAAFPEALLESELFGHRKGVFARPEGVVRPGVIEKAHGGTLFLSHVESLLAGVQVGLLPFWRSAGSSVSAIILRLKWTCASSPPPLLN